MCTCPFTLWIVELKDRASWETLLNAAKIRKFKAVVEIAENLGEPDIAAVKYHQKCCSLFKKRAAKLFCELVQILVQVIEILLYLNVKSAKNYLLTVRKCLIYVSN